MHTAFLFILMRLLDNHDGRLIGGRVEFGKVGIKTISGEVKVSNL